MNEKYMKQALDLASKGLGRTLPNPVVGAVVVKNRKVVGSGYHRRVGAAHAEVEALNHAGAQSRGATLYVTLEPCCHVPKRTPPCTGRIIKSGIRQVVVAMRDPNPRVNGRGLAILKKEGIKIVEGVLERKARKLNAEYLKSARRQRPWVILKCALTLDGKISRRRGLTTRITSRDSERYVHRLRSQVDAILVGIGTVLADDPRLTVRYFPSPRAPHRIVLDGRLKIPLSSRLVQSNSLSRTIIVTTQQAKARKIDELRRQNVDVWVMKKKAGKIAFKPLLTRLYRAGISSLLIEGGAEVNASAIREGIVDRIIWILAPRLLGGEQAPSAIGGRDPLGRGPGVLVRNLKLQRIGEDFLIEGAL